VRVVAAGVAAVLVVWGAVACSQGNTGSVPAGEQPGANVSGALPKITVAGDSISVGLGAALRPATATVFEVKVIGQEGSGLARPDRFDWPERLRELARDFPPAVLVFSVGSNDAQDLTDHTGKVLVPVTNTAAWDAAYSSRLAEAFDAFAGSSTKVVWVGHVRTAEDRVGLANRHIHELAATVASTRPFVTVLDFGELLQTGDETADRCLMPDGLHLTVACLDEAAGKLRDQLPR